MYNVDIGYYMREGLVTVKKAAAIMGVSTQTIRRWDKNNKLKSFRHPINNYRLYRIVDLEKIVQKLEKI